MTRGILLRIAHIQDDGVATIDQLYRLLRIDFPAGAYGHALDERPHEHDPADQAYGDEKDVLLQKYPDIRLHGGRFAKWRKT